MTRPTPKAAIDLIKSFEKCELKAYHGAADPAEVWTVGWGHTGPDVHKGLTVSQAQADRWLDADIAVAAARLAGVVKSEMISKLTDGQYGALISFVFNLGANPDWTIWKRLNEGNLDDVPRQMLRFVNSAGKKRLGLERRRGEEVALWASDPPKKEKPADLPPSSVTRTIETPPTPAPAPPLAKESQALKIGQLVTGGLGTAATTAAAVKETVAPHAASVPFFAKVAMVCTVIVVLFALWQLWVARKQNQARKV